ncbi:hypothetical protein JTB14_028645 [Gonioctena quinquepunctata]|nr:hypothetical protein JTB14_028645 [Gonioctena quinquepunctata]
MSYISACWQKYDVAAGQDQGKRMDNYEDTNSVDLTEDEDSRDTIIASGDDNFEQRTTYYTGNNSSMQRLPVSSPPPLTPIPRFSSPGKLPIDQLHSVPMLRKIRKPSSTPQRSPAKGVTLISSTVVKPASSDSTISLDSDDEDVRIFQDKYENLEIQKTSVTSTVNSSVSQRPPGKVVVIKKNNKVYKVIIPHNVMPTPNQVGGPVLINIPEIGPLVIRIDPDAKTHGTQLKPFSLNFDEILKKSSIKSPVDKNIHSTPNKASDMLRKTSFELVPNKEALLSDPRFCWSFKRMKQRKKGLFMPSDIFGFTKTDSRQVSKCHRILDSIVIKKQLELRLMMASFEKLKEKTNKKHCIKPVKISEIVGDSMEDKLFEKKGTNPKTLSR